MRVIAIFKPDLGHGLNTKGERDAAMKIEADLLIEFIKSSRFGHMLSSVAIQRASSKPDDYGLTPNERRVLDYLRKCAAHFCLYEGGPVPYLSPTKIGFEVTKDIKKHSAWASPILKRLVAKGLVERSSAGKYRIVEKS